MTDPNGRPPADGSMRAAGLLILAWCFLVVFALALVSINPNSTVHAPAAGGDRSVMAGGGPTEIKRAAHGPN